MSRDLILRVQSGDHGMTRITVKQSDPTSAVYEKVREAFSLDNSGWELYRERSMSKNDKIPKSKTTVSKLGLPHGHILYLKPGTQSTSASTSAAAFSPSTYSADRPSSSGLNGVVAGAPNPAVTEDPVDRQLDQSDGRIVRNRNEQMCRHGPTGKCLHCVPLEPFDETYLKSCDPPIKFLSFHSYIRKLRSGVDKGKFVNLENLSCRIKSCKEHAPWPAGICTKCQPNAVTLNRQVYRHVDFIQFENGNILDRFINYWRQSGRQRMGYLIGRYEVHPDMPLAIRAVVSAIYEPPQTCTRNSIEMHDDADERLVDDLAAALGMCRVGWVFTDLAALDLSSGTVKHTRGSVDSYFLSAEECITAAAFQNKYPNPCRWSSDGVFGSKFVTVVVTGDKDNHIHFEGYQVSDQCMGLVNDECLVPTFDAPELGYIKESSNQQYVPDVFFKEKDEYGNEVTRLGRPLPVEYLLTDMSVAFPKEQIYSFRALSHSLDPFAACNRADIGFAQDLSALANYMHQFSEDNFLDAIADFNILVYLSHCDVLPMKEHMLPLLEAIREQDHVKALHWSHSEQWSTMTHLLQASVPSPTTSGATGGSMFGLNASPLPPIGSSWQCKHCTFINTSANQCDMCSLPKS